jgi:hypothetical protein
MTNSMWSGPSRALQFHLSLYENVADIFKYLASLPGTDDSVHINARVDPRYMPIQLKQRLRLMTASTGVEGASVVNLRDNVARMFDQDNFDRTQQTMRSEFMALNEGETHYMSLSVQAAILAAAETMEAEPLFMTDLPCPSGVIVFEYPLMTDDLHPDTGETVPGLLMPVRAIAWSPSNVTRQDGSVHMGICYSIYTEAESYKRFYCSTYETLIGEDPDLYDLTAGADELRSWLTDTSGWAFGVPWGHDTYGEGVSFIRRFLLAYFRWTWQRILVPTPYSPSRAERKWVSRIKAPLQDGHIKVLRLRREVEHERKYGTEYMGIYDHQFIVRGHWRRQWYKTLGPAKIDGEFNPESHRLVYVEAFVKGNPNGPLIVGHDVVAAVR